MNLSFFAFALISVTTLVSCGVATGPHQAYESFESDSTAIAVIDQAIARHGGKRYQEVDLQFTFREKEYRIKKQGEEFRYERNFQDKNQQQIHDVLDNQGFSRSINEKVATLSEVDSGKYANSVNSVAYFALLPYPLSDAAVNKKYLGMSTLKGKTYHKVQVGFEREGGGKDFEDSFVYWIHSEDYTMDYLAYLYHVDGGGIRFREAINIQEVKGLRFADYLNYKADYHSVKLGDTDRLFEEGKLEKLSEIRLERLSVKLLGKVD